MTRSFSLLATAIAAGSPLWADESHFLSEVRQLTFAGARAGEGYFSADGKKMVFQSEREEGNPFFQIYVLDMETGDTKRVSTGVGKTTCAWIHPDGERVLFASTHSDPEATKKQEEEIAFRESGQERRYSWDYDENYELYSVPTSGGEAVRLTSVKGYDAEGSFSPDGEWIAFASNRHAYEGELPRDQWARFKMNKSHAMEIYRMRTDGSGLERLTETPGYDGGPFFSADGSKICWRRFDEKGTTAEIWTMDADGSNKNQLTRIGAMSWAPYFHPSGEYLIFATNTQGFANFELYLVDAAGEKEPVRVTTTDGFDGLPAFSPDGARLTWTSNRTSGKKSQIFIGNWDHAAALEALGLGRAAAEPTVTAVPGTAEAIGADDIRKHIETLASEEMGGRLTGTQGEKIATQYVADVLASYGLEPAGDDGTFFQEFPFTAGVALGGDNSLEIDGQSFKAGDGGDWTPLSFSLTGDLGEGGVVFAGYGIEAPSEPSTTGGDDLPEYSSYVHLDVKDKWVMVFRYLPEDITPEVRQRFGRYASLRYKAMVARRKGAKGIIVVSGPNSKVKNQLVRLRFDASLAGSGIGAISVTDDVAEVILGRPLQPLQDAHDTGEMQSGFTAKERVLKVRIDVEQEKRTGRNVLARLASGEESRPAVVVGAHVDGLGSGGGGNSRATEQDASGIHYGADDNASGVAGVLEIAELLATQHAAGELSLERDVLFGAWSGEELGLLGSSYFVSELSGDEDKLDGEFAAYLNMDMVGRLEKALVLQGVGSSSYWAAEIERRNAPMGLPLVIQEESYLPTDATSFYLKGVPVLSAFTGAHEDYHTPADTPDKINYEGAEDVIRLIGLVARGLATSTSVPDYKAMEKPEEKGARAGLRAYLGTVPDYAQGDETGVKLSGVAKGGPADKAGVTSGDVIVGLAGQEVKNIYDYTYVIGALKIGEEVSIVVLRGEETIELKVVPESRS